MADSTQPLSPALRIGVGLALAAVLALVLGTLAAVLARAKGFGALGPADWAAVRFTVNQAAISAALSIAFAVPVARALARRRFVGRGLLVTALGAPFLLPVIVAVMGLLTIFGRAGTLNGMLGLAGVQPISIYGFGGVVLAHVFLNLPLAVRLLLHGWLAIPAERFRLAASLGFGTGAMLRHLEWPMLRAVVPSAFVAILLICLTSFTVALTLGGGPRATTLELAIYQALRFDFDPGRAATLAVLQLALSALAMLLALKLAVPAAFGAGLDRPVQRWDADGAVPRAADAVALVGATLFLAAPLAAVVVEGSGHVAGLPASVWQAALRSLGVALGSGALALAMALPLSLGAARSRRRGWVEAAGMLPLATSALVVGTGLMLLLRPLTNVTALALPVTAAVNAVMVLPFCLRVMSPAARTIEADYGRLADSLGLAGAARLRILILPRMRPALGFAAGLATAMSMGDLGVIALFAGADNATLPLALYRLMGAYRTADAAGAAMLLLALSLALFWVFDRGGRIDAGS